MWVDEKCYLINMTIEITCYHLPFNKWLIGRLIFISKSKLIFTKLLWHRWFFILLCFVSILYQKKTANSSVCFLFCILLFWKKAGSHKNTLPKSGVARYLFYTILWNNLSFPTYIWHISYDLELRDGRSTFCRKLDRFYSLTPGKASSYPDQGQVEVD